MFRRLGQRSQSTYFLAQAYNDPFRIEKKIGRDVYVLTREMSGLPTIKITHDYKPGQRVIQLSKPKHLTLWAVSKIVFCFSKNYKK